MSMTTVALDAWNGDDIIVSGSVIKGNHAPDIRRVDLVIRGTATVGTGLMNKVKMSHRDIKKNFIG